MKTYNTIQKLTEQHAALCDYIHVVEVNGEYCDNKMETLQELLYESLDKDSYNEALILIDKLQEIIQVAIDGIQLDFNRQARKQGVRI